MTNKNRNDIRMTNGELKTPCNGFTLVEVVTIAVIVGVLAAAAIPSYRYYVVRSRIDMARSTCEMIGAAIVFTHQGGQDIGGSEGGDAWDELGLKRVPDDGVWTYGYDALRGDEDMDAGYSIRVVPDMSGPMKSYGRTGKYLPYGRTPPLRWEGFLKGN